MNRTPNYYMRDSMKKRGSDRQGSGDFGKLLSNMMTEQKEQNTKEIPKTRNRFNPYTNK